MKKQRRRGVRKVPWKKLRRKGVVTSFLEQATPLALFDQRRLVELGWNPCEAAVEAWLTMEAGGE